MYERARYWLAAIGLSVALLGATDSQAVTVVSTDYRLPAKLDPDIAAKSRPKSGPPFGGPSRWRLLPTR